MALTDAEKRLKTAGFQRAKAAQEEEGAKRRLLSIEQELATLGKEHFKSVRDLLGVTEDLAKIAKFRKDIEKGVHEGTRDEAEDLLNGMKASVEKRKAIMQTAPGMVNIAAGAKKTFKNVKMMATSWLGIGSLIFAAFKYLLDFQKAVTDTRKDLGVSYASAVSLTVQTKALGFAAKAWGLDQADIAASATAIRQELGTSAQEALNLSLNFARTASATGQTYEGMAKTLSVMESISSASRDVLINQMRTNAAMIEAAGVAPGDVMKDIAGNAEYFAKFAKDGGSNLINAGTAARKLGLNMSHVASVSNSLLDFESSIEKQLEVSMLLGRQINLDKARQLAFTGKHKEMMEEVLKQVGGEAEFSKMNYIQREKLAQSVGVEVEQLARLVRNNASAGVAGVGGAVSAAMGDFQKVSAENSSKSVELQTEANIIAKKQLDAVI